MTTDPFNEALLDAEFLAGRPPAPTRDLARRVRRRLARRRARIASGGFAFAVALAAISIYVRPASTPPPLSVDSDRLTAGEGLPPGTDRPLDLVRIKAESSAVVARLMREQLAADDRLAPSIEVAGESSIDPRLIALRQIEESSLRLVLNADRLARDERFRTAAIQQYQSVIRLFPGSAGSRAAGDRLAVFEKQGVF